MMWGETGCSLYTVAAGGIHVLDTPNHPRFNPNSDGAWQHTLSARRLSNYHKYINA
jgi:hypothetical protein